MYNRGRIIGLYQGGHNKIEIARIMGCSSKTVALWIRKYEEGGINNLQDHRKNNKRPQKTTVEQNEEIVQTIDENPFDAASTVLHNMNVNISAITVTQIAQDIPGMSFLSPIYIRTSMNIK